MRELDTKSPKKQDWETSLVVQWLRIYLPKQGTQVQSLVQEDPTCFRAIKPMHLSNWSLPAAVKTQCSLKLKKKKVGLKFRVHWPRRHLYSQSLGSEQQRYWCFWSSPECINLQTPMSLELGCLLWQNLPGQFIFINKTWRLLSQAATWGEAGSQSLCLTSPALWGERPGNRGGKGRGCNDLGSVCAQLSWLLSWIWMDSGPAT